MRSHRDLEALLRLKTLSNAYLKWCHFGGTWEQSVFIVHQI